MIAALERLQKTNITDTVLSNRAWVQFVTDHTRILLDNSELVELDVNDLAKYRFRVKHLFLKYDVSPDDAWIVLRINDIQLSTGIPEYIKSIRIPLDDKLQWLKEQFNAHVSEGQ